MDLALIKQRLNQEIEGFLKSMYPQGKKVGNEFAIGSTTGEAGDSLKVRLTGAKMGVWSDFATGESGDILDLVVAKRGGTLKDNLLYLGDYMGISSPKPILKKTYTAVKRPSNLTKPKNTVVEYLSQRGLTAETLAAFQIGQLNNTDIKLDGQHVKSDCVAFPCFDAEQNLRLVKYLALERTKEGKKVFWSEANCRPTLFGWRTIKPTDRTVVICEGEINAMSWFQYGIPALATPRGAGKGAKHDWIGEEWDDLARFEEIFLDFDPDDAGREAIDDLTERLGRHRIRVVQRGDFSGDINDRLKAGHTKETIEALIEYAKAVTLETLKAPSQYLTQVSKLLYDDADLNGWELPFANTGNFRLRPSELSIWTGYNFHGKTSMLSFVTLDLIVNADVRAMVVSPELRPERQLQRLLRQATGVPQPEKKVVEEAFDWMAGKYWLFDEQGAIRVDQVFEAAQYAIRRYGVQFIVVDSLMKLGLAVEDWSGQKLLTERFHTFALQNNVHIALVAHPRKEGNEGQPPTRHSVAGVGHITDIADTVMVVWRNMPKHKALAARSQGITPFGNRKQDENLDYNKIEKAHDCLLIAEKERNGDGDVFQLPLWYDKYSMQYRDRRDLPLSKPILNFGQTPTTAPAEPQPAEANPFETGDFDVEF